MCKTLPVSETVPGAWVHHVDTRSDPESAFRPLLIVQIPSRSMSVRCRARVQVGLRAIIDQG
jgi:hypothetical protein